VKVVVDHVSGSRRGQRQEIIWTEPISFGRHPSCTVSFDAHRDLDASSRHCELLADKGGALVQDVGSSNGTFVGGQRMTSHFIEMHGRVVVEFGPGGPQVAIWVGEDDDPAPPVPSYPTSTGPPMWLWAMVVVAVLAAAVVGIIQLSR
jgi:hypothetical protein